MNGGDVMLRDSTAASLRSFTGPIEGTHQVELQQDASLHGPSEGGSGSRAKNELLYQERRLPPPRVNARTEITPRRG